MKTIHIFGKSVGCAKCAMLKKRVAALMEQEPYKPAFQVDFHDLLTEDGLVEFCKANVNPNRVPALVIGDENGYCSTPHDADEPLHDKAVLFPYLGICTDYGEEGHKGVISPAMIENLLKEAMKQP